MAIKTLLHDLTPPYNSIDVATVLHQYLRYQAPQLYVQIHTDTEWVFFRTTNLGNARLHAIIDRLLLLARAEAQTLPLQRGLHAVDTFIQEFAEDATVLAEERDMQFLVACCDAGEAAFDPTWIRQVLFNMLNNSLKFSPEGSTITLCSTLYADTWSFEMTDEGPGIPPAYLPHIFDRFVQVDPQSELRSGSGLGLAICKSLVELHQGHLECANRTCGQGLVVRCTLPRMWPA